MRPGELTTFHFWFACCRGGLVMQRARKCIGDVALTCSRAAKRREHKRRKREGNPSRVRTSNLQTSLMSRTGRKQAAVTIGQHPVSKAVYRGVIAVCAEV